MIVQEPVQAAIWHCLNHYSYKDAIFLAERLYAEVKSDDALFLLATSYYRAGKPGRALSILEVNGCRTAQSKFLMARCCLDLNKLKESEVAVTGGNVIRCKTHEDVINEFGDTACFAMQLLGQICGRTERHEEAAEAFKRSLGLNPFLWSSFESVCNLGEKPDPYKIFQISSLENFNMCQGTNALIQLVNQSTATVQEGSFDTQETNFSTSTPLQTAILPSHPALQVVVARNVIDSSSETSQDSCGPTSQQPQQIHQQSSTSLLNRFTRLRCHGIRTLFNASSANSPVSPCFGMFPLDNTLSMDVTPNCLALITPPNPPLIDTQSTEIKSKTPTTRLGHVLSPPKPHVFSQSSNMNANMGISPATMGLQVANDSNVRRSTRLFSSCNSVKENNKSPPSKVRFASSKVSPRRPKTRTTKATITQPTITENTEYNKPENVVVEKPPSFTSITQQALYWQKSAAEGLMLLMQEMGMGYLHLAHYNCNKAIEVLSSLPPQHYNTGWVLSNLGRAYFELCNYKKAVIMFSEARLCERHHMEGAEYYSTALWHLQREVSLSALAQQLTYYEMNSPETWCVTGNCFSLQKEHDAAIKFFHRAIQVDPNFAYAYTLLGHEYVQTEEMDKAMACFRNAIRIDSRHYNAWYGIGMIYYKQEKFLLAEFHYKKALSINHQSSVLMCHIAVVQHSLQKTDAALGTLNRAIATDAKNPLCKFHRASIYFAIDRHSDALNELEELKEIVPEESLVYFLMGKVHKKLGNTHLALMNFSWAMDLDPKGANNQIKEAIDKRYANDDDGVLANAETGTGVLNATLDEGNGGDAEALDHESSNYGSNIGSEDMQLMVMESDESL